MRRFLPLFIFVLISLNATAQFLPNNGQAFQFMPLYNPAFTGIESFGDLKLSYRYQWSGFGSNAPKFMNLAYITRLKQPLDLAYNGPRTSHTSGLSSNNFPKGKTVAHGLGINVFTESYGPVTRTGGGLSYAFSYALSRKMRLAAGAGVILENQKINIAEITVQDPNDEYYNRLLNSGSSQTILSARAGVLLYSNSFYFGASYLPVWSTILQSSAEDQTQEEFYKASAQFGISIALTPEFILKPSAVALLQLDDQLQIDYSLKAFIRERLWIGATYRDIESVIPMAGFMINDLLSASYSYELSTSGFKQFSDASHELVISFRINNFKKLKQYTW
jgi:type IX secretion system PorP/SprF family membrane protein